MLLNIFCNRRFSRPAGARAVSSPISFEGRDDMTIGNGMGRARRVWGAAAALALAAGAPAANAQAPKMAAAANKAETPAPTPPPPEMTLHPPPPPPHSPPF